MRNGMRVVFKPPIPTRKAATGKGAEIPEHIPGIWLVLDRSPNGWWVYPADNASREWVAAHRDRTVSGCIQAFASQLEQEFIAAQRRQ